MITKKAKKDDSLHVRLPNRTKTLVLDEAKRSNRTIQQEIVCLIAEALHAREYNIEKYV